MKNKTLIISLITIGMFAIVLSTYAKISNIKHQKDYYHVTIHDVPDTNIILNGNNLITKYFDKTENIEKELEIVMKNGKVKEVLLNGEKLSKEEQKKYDKEISHCINTAKQAKQDIREAKEELEEIDLSRIYQEIEEAKAEIEDINIEEINHQIELALKEVKEIDRDQLAHSLEIAKEELEKINWAEINRELENVQVELQEAFSLLEDENFQKTMQVSMEQMHDIIPDLGDIMDASQIIIPDYSTDSQESVLDKAKESDLDEKLRSLEAH